MIFWLSLLICIDIFLIYSCLFLFTYGFGVFLFCLSITIYYFLIKKLIFDESLFMLSITGFILEWLATLFLPTNFYWISEWPITLFFHVARSQKLDAFLFCWWLMKFIFLELLIRLISLLLNILNHGTNSFCNFLSCPNTCLNTRFCAIMRIFSFLLAWFFVQVLPIQT